MLSILLQAQLVDPNGIATDEQMRDQQVPCMLAGSGTTAVSLGCCWADMAAALQEIQQELQQVLGRHTYR